MTAQKIEDREKRRSTESERRWDSESREDCNVKMVETAVQIETSLY